MILGKFVLMLIYSSDGSNSRFRSYTDCRISSTGKLASINIIDGIGI